MPRLSYNLPEGFNMTCKMLLEVKLSKFSKENICCKDQGPNIYFMLKEKQHASMTTES
jgi:hypothetical protein